MHLKSLPDWRKFGAHSPEFSELTYIAEALPASEVAALSNYLTDAIRNMTHSEASRPKVRAFRSGALDYRLSELLVRTGPGEGQTATEWLRSAAGSQPGCVAINNLAAWSLPLADWFTGAIKSITVDAGFEPLAGTDIYTFIAESEWTPFGIHCDDEPSMIFHLGPAEKTVWVWPEDVLPSNLFIHSPSFNGISFEIEENLHLSQRITLRPGDFISIPRGRYHLFRNEGPSAFIGLTIYPFSMERTLLSALPTIIERLTLPSPDKVRTVAEFRSAVQGAGREPAIPHEIAHMVADEFTRQQAIARTYGYIATPEQVALPSPEALPARLRGAFPGVAASDGPGTVLVRGRTIRANAPIDFNRIVTLMDNGEPYSLADLTAVLEVDADNARKIVAGIFNLGGLVAA